MIEGKFSRSDYPAEAGVKRGEHEEYNIFGNPAIFFSRRRSVMPAGADYFQQGPILS